MRGTNREVSFLRQHLHVIEVSVVELLPVLPGEVVWTASLWTGCVHLLSQSWPLPGQHKHLGHHRQDQIPQLPKFWGEKTAVRAGAVRGILTQCERVIMEFYPHPSQVSCSVSLWMDRHLFPSVSTQPVCFHSRGDTAVSPPSKSGTGSTSWWSLWWLDALTQAKCGGLLVTKVK